MIKEINAAELKERLDHVVNDIFLLDVREISEFEQYNIGGTLIPLGQLPNRLSEIPTDNEIVVVCKSGGRSLRAVQYILQNREGANVYNLKGGLMAWESIYG